MQKKAAQKFVDRKAHQPLLVLMGRVAPAEANSSLCQGDQPVIGNRHSMGVAAQIAQRVFGSAKRAFAIDHPIGAEQRTEPGGERWGRLEMGKVTVKSQLAFGVEFAEARHELAAEDTAEDFDGQKEAGLCGDPALVVGTQSAGRDDAVNMRMVQQLLIPGMQHAEESDLRPQMFGVASNLEQSLGAGAEQQTIDLCFVLQGQRS